MGPRLPQTSLNGSQLTAWLARMSLLDGPAAAPSFAEGLGRWLGWKEALPLAAALQATPRASAASVASVAFVAADTTPGPSGTPPPASAVDREFDRVRASLARTIDNDGALAGETDYLPCRRHIMAVQQAMDAAIGPLRAQARAAAARHSPALRRLAALDAVMEPVVGTHEQALLAMLPSLLERHFTRLRQASGGGDWTQAFRQDLRHALQAELTLRLQPTEGLLDALRAHTTRDP